MVWTAGESPLYNCVEKFNNTPREERGAPAGTPCGKQIDLRSDSSQKPCEDSETCRCDSAQKPHSEPETCRCDSAQKPCGEPEKFCCGRETGRDSPAPPKPQMSSAKGNFLQRITGDRDFMLIAALILLLLHEKADMKLIAALAFIILT